MKIYEVIRLRECSDGKVCFVNRFKKEAIAAFLSRRPGDKDIAAKHRAQVKLRKQRENAYAISQKRKQMITENVIQSLIPGISTGSAPIDYQLKTYFIFYLLVLIVATTFIVLSLPTHWFKNCLFPVGDPRLIVLITKTPPNEVMSSAHEIPAKILRNLSPHIFPLFSVL